MVAGSAVEALGEALTALWEAAGRPVRNGLLRIPGMKDVVKRSTLSDWMRGKSAPSKGNSKAFFALIDYLNGRVAPPKGPTPAGLLRSRWKKLLEDAQAEKQNNRGGRPPQAAKADERVPTYPAAHLEGVREDDRALREHDLWVRENVLSDVLIGREEELAELLAFCTAAEGGAGSGYAWWQAGPWAGKTALLADFVVRGKPSDSVEVVSYFIGRRLANNDRSAFLDGVARQLAVVAGLKMTREMRRPAAFPGLCADAAAACRARGRSLLLVVDGLDEGVVETGRSIAGVLPKRLPRGMLVLVSGRPNPRIPDEVAVDHPLRYPEIVRLLASSADAKVIRSMATQDLEELLDDRVGSALLSLLTVAQGGLSGADLACLTGVRPRDIDVKLHRITGRNFVAEKSSYRPGPDLDADARTYVLGHDELYRTALAGLGEGAVSEAVQLLHNWAEEYREAGWPTDTPAYLLYSYPALLDRTDEVGRLADVVLDPRRQVELLRRSSADAAVGQLELTRQRLRQRGEVDLGTLAALGVSWDVLTEGAGALPPSLAEALARLGHVQRALEVARAAAHPADRAQRLAELACVLAEVDPSTAVEAAQEAAALARRARLEADIGEEFEADVAAGDAAVALLTVGQDDEGLELLAVLRPWAAPKGNLCVVFSRASLAVRPRSVALAEELLERAQRIAGEVQVERLPDPAAPITAWAAIASAATPAREAEMYAKISEYAGSLPLRGLPSSYVRACAAKALCSTRPERAVELALQSAQQIEDAVSGPDASTRDEPLDRVDLEIAVGTSVDALAAVGEVERARALAAGVPAELRVGVFGSVIRSSAFDGLVGSNAGPAESAARQAVQLAREGVREEAERLLGEATAEQDSPVWHRWETDLDRLAQPLAAVGRFADAEVLAVSLVDPLRRVLALAAVAIEAAAAGNLPDTHRLALEAAEISRGLDGAGNFSIFAGSPGDDVITAQAAAAQALARAGDREAALALVEEIALAKPAAAARATTAVAAALRFTDLEGAVRLVDTQRERLMTGDEKPGGKICELVLLLVSIADADEQCAERIEQAIDETWSSNGIAALENEDQLAVAILESHRQREPALQLLDRVERSLQNVPPEHRDCGALAIARAAFGDIEGARRAALDTPVPFGRAVALAAVAGYLSRAEMGFRSMSYSAQSELQKLLHPLALLVAPPDADGSLDTAAGFARSALEEGGWRAALPALAHVAPQAVERVRDIVFTYQGISRRRP
ncbi:MULTISPECIES: hypothetical protein [Streptacidiphilus]|uniref:NACHT domain-containing protein n=1 Tax=Streptacidiphilus cavernicola TaxID=3342716 RepID=A0ABV6UHA1_9ACTN|nr:hypothetical protein [Streptacidiphilus jeojiense]